MTSHDETHFVDATDEYGEYRSMLRGLWNSYLWSDPNTRDWEMVEHFKQVRAFLAEKLLGEKLRRRLDLEQEAPLNAFVVPVVNSIGPEGSAPIRISESLKKPGGRDWNQAPHTIRMRDLTLVFRDFFDWGELGFWDLQYFLVEIASSDVFPELVGREALIEVKYARVIVFPGTVGRGEVHIVLDRLALESQQHVSKV